MRVRDDVVAHLTATRRFVTLALAAFAAALLLAGVALYGASSVPWGNARVLERRSPPTAGHPLALVLRLATIAAALEGDHRAVMRRGEGCRIKSGSAMNADGRVGLVVGR